MKPYLKEIGFISKIQGEHLWHDPLYDQVTFDSVLDRWIFQHLRPLMNYARPLQSIIRKWDSVTDDWEILSIDEYDSHYRPSEFYDHYYSSNEIDKLPNKKKLLQDSLNYLKKESELMNIQPGYYNPQILIIEKMLADNISFVKAMHLFIKEQRFRIVKNIPFHGFMMLNEYPGSTSGEFDETWNTVDYVNMFIPKRRTYFVNSKTCECSCQLFKRYRYCSHNKEYLIRRILYSIFENTQLMIDITPFILEYAKVNPIYD